MVQEGKKPVTSIFWKTKVKDILFKVFHVAGWGKMCKKEIVRVINSNASIFLSTGHEAGMRQRALTGLLPSVLLGN